MSLQRIKQLWEDFVTIALGLIVVIGVLVLIGGILWFDHKVCMARHPNAASWSCWFNSSH